MAQDADDAISDSFWSVVVTGKERGCRSVDLEGDMEKLEVVGPWSSTEGGSVDPKWKVGHRSARVKAAREESEKLKEAEMEVDGEVPQGESAAIQTPKRKVIRVESEETQVKLWQSARKKQRRWASCRALSANHEGPFIGATIDAVKKPSDTGRLRQWLLKKVVKPAQAICVSSAC